MGGSSKQTVGYRYSLGMHVGLCHGPVDGIFEFRFDDRSAWTGNAAGGTITINAPSLFGGDKKEGGVSGDIDVEMGYPDQLQNAYLQSQLGQDISAYRGVTCLVFNQFYWGNNPYLKPFKVLVGRTDVTTRGEVQWNVEDAKIARPGDDASEPDECSYGNFTLSAEPAFESFFPRSAGVASLSVTGSTGWGNGGFSITEVDADDAPLGEACGNDSRFVLQQALNLNDGGGFLTAPSLQNALSIQGFIIARGRLPSDQFIDVSLIDHSLEYLFDAGGSNLDNPVTPRMGVIVQYDTGNNRARFGALLNDTNLSGLDTVWGDYFDVEASSRQWLAFTYSIVMTDFRVESYLVGAGFTRYRLFVTYAINACVRHLVNGSERTNSFNETREALLTEGWTAEIDNIRPDPSATEVPLCMYDGEYQLASYYFLTDGGALCPAISLFLPQAGDCSDMNPAHIIRECITDDQWGMGYLETDVSDSEWQDCADTLRNEQMGMSLIWDTEQPIEDFIGEVLRHIDAVIYVSRETGKFVLRLIRDDADSNTITLDESNVSGVNAARRQTIDELTNQLTVVYWDCKTRERASVTVHNEALRKSQGTSISTTVEYPGFSNKEMASRAAERDLKALSTPLLDCQVVANREAAVLNMGDVFYLNWPDLNIDNVLMRVNEIDYGDGRDNSITISCIQDVFATPSQAVQVETTEQWVDPASILPEKSVARLVTETPYYTIAQELGESAANDILTDDPDAGFVLVSGGRQGSELNANVLVDSGAGFEDSALLDFHPYAYVVEEVTETETEFSISGGVDLEEVAPGTVAQIGEEIVRVDSLTQDSNGEFVSVTVGRGVLDTVPQEHPLTDSNGTFIKFWGDYAVSDETQYAANEEIDVQIQTARGNALLESPPTDSVLLDSRAIRPYAPGDLRVDGVSYPEIGTSNEVVWAPEHTVTWAHRDRLQQTSGTLFDHTDTDIGPEAGTTYRVELFSTLFNQVDTSPWWTASVGSVNSYTIQNDSNAPPEPPVNTETVNVRVVSVRDGYDSWQSPVAKLYYESGSNAVDSVGFDSVGLDSSGTITALVLLPLQADFTDASGNQVGSNAPVVLGASISATEFKWGSASAEFLGSVDRIEFGNPILPETGDFTFECWAFANSTSGTQQNVILSQYDVSPAAGRTLLGLDNGNLSVFNPADGRTTASGSFPTSQWVHIAYVRDGSSFKVYQDGTEVISQDWTGATVFQGAATVIGVRDHAGSPQSENWDGYLQDIRIEPSAIYTGNFTPPTGPFPT